MKAVIVDAAARSATGAAGQASAPPALTPIAERALIDHVIDAVHENGILSVVCVAAAADAELEAHCRRAWPQISFDFIAAEPEIAALEQLSGLIDERYVVLRTDCLFPADVLQEFLATAAHLPAADVLLGVCSYVGDENPLWTELHCDGRVLTLGDAAQQSRLMATGIALLEPRTFAEIPTLKRRGHASWPDFFTHLLECGYRLIGERVPHGIVLATPDDFAAAEYQLRL